MTDVYVELDDDGDVVRMVPGAAVVDYGGTINYYLATKDGTDWQFDGYVDPSGVIASAAASTQSGRNGEPGMQVTMVEDTSAAGGSGPDQGVQYGITLLYSLTFDTSGANMPHALDNRTLPSPLVFRKSNDPIIVFR